MAYESVVIAFSLAGDVLQLRASSKHWRTECPPATLLMAFWRTLLTVSRGGEQKRAFDDASIQIGGEQKNVWNAHLLVGCQIELALSKAAFGRPDILAMLQPGRPQADGEDCPRCGEERFASKCATCGYTREHGGIRRARDALPLAVDEAVDHRTASHYFLDSVPQLRCIVCKQKRGEAALKHSWKHPDAEIKARPVYICVGCIMRDKTLLLPIRFGRESFGYDLAWALSHASDLSYPNGKRYAEIASFMQYSLKRRRREPRAYNKETEREA